MWLPSVAVWFRVRFSLGWPPFSMPFTPRTYGRREPDRQGENNWETFTTRSRRLRQRRGERRARSQAAAVSVHGTPDQLTLARVYPDRYVPMRRRIPTAHVAVARTAPTLHRLRLGSRSARAIRPHAAARRTACTCDHDARTRAPDTRATRTWILLCGRAGCAARAHRPGWARRAIDARPSTPRPPGGTRRRRQTESRVLATRHPTWRTRTLAARPSRRAAPAVPRGAAPGRTATA